MPSCAFHQDNPPPISFAWQLGISCDFCCLFFVMSRWACRNTTRWWSMLSWTPSNKKSLRGDTAVTSHDLRSGVELNVIPVVILDRWAKHQERWMRKWCDEHIVDSFDIISFLFDLKQAVQKTRAAEIIGCIVVCSSSRCWWHVFPWAKYRGAVSPRCQPANAETPLKGPGCGDRDVFNVGDRDSIRKSDIWWCSTWHPSYLYWICNTFFLSFRRLG